MEILSVSSSRFYASCWEARQSCIWITTATGGSGSGTQDNDFWLWSRQTNATYAATGILIDGQGDKGSGDGNVSLNRFNFIEATYDGGDGIVVGYSDTNEFGQIRSSHVGALLTGNPAVFANNSYVPPSTIAVSGYTYDNYY